MIIYLATPYTHPRADVRDMRFEASNRVAALVMQQGHSVFSPISHSHPIAKYLPGDLLTDHEFWMGQDLPLLAVADELWVYPPDAADVSRGVAREVDEAKRMGKPIKYIWPDEVA